MAKPVDMFTFFCAKLTNNRYRTFNDYLKKFSSLKTNLDRVNFVYKDFREECANFPPFIDDIKDDTTAFRKRQEGNDFFKLKNYREALCCYTMSILTAKSDTILGMAYANRSAALFRLELYEECLVDIERALEHGYPDDFKPKLIKRRQQCKAQKTPRWKYYESTPIILDSEKNRWIECAKNCVQIVWKNQYGRCVVATKDIEIGEVLAVEEVYAAVVNDEIYIHCHECLELCYNLIPCQNCTQALYCSENCKNKAFQTYHKYECPILLSLNSIVLDYPKRLALKIALMAKNELQLSNDYQINLDEVYRSQRFKEVTYMEGHVTKRHPENLLARTIIAAALFQLIKTHTTLFEEGVNEDCLKKSLLNLLLICSLNTVNIDELSKVTLNYDLTPFATAIYSFFTIFNHSCYANVIRQFHGSKMVMRARNSIKKGEQCFVNYGPNCSEHCKSLRQNFLSDYYFFTCNCQACEEDWPTTLYSVGMSDVTGTFLLMKLTTTIDVNEAKREQRKLLAKAKKTEDDTVKRALRICYNIFGNKRVI